MSIIIPVVTFLLGSFLESVFRIWDRLTPEVRLHAKAETEHIETPPGSSGATNTFSLIRLSNHSRRTKATNIRLTIELYTNDAPIIGQVTTTEDPSAIQIKATPLDMKYLIELCAPRLAPRATIELPVWHNQWMPFFPGAAAHLAGTCDQTTIVTENGLNKTRRTRIIIAVAIALGLASITILWPFLKRLHNNPRPTQVTLNVPAAVPRIPGLVLREPDTVLVTQTPDADSTVVERADMPTGPWQTYVIPVHAPENTAVIHLSQPHASFWVRAYSKNEFGRSSASKPIRLPDSHSAPTHD